MPVPSLFSRLIAIRRARAKARRAAFGDALTAARGDPDSVSNLRAYLAEAAGEPEAAGDVDAFMYALGGGK